MTLQKYVFQPITVLQEKYHDEVDPLAPGFAFIEQEEENESVQDEFDEYLDKKESKVEFTEEELEKLKQEHIEQGYKRAKEEIDQSILADNQEMKNIIADLKQKLEEAIEQIKNKYTQDHDEMIRFALYITKKVTEDIISEQKVQIITKSLERLVEIMGNNKVITINVDPAIKKDLEETLVTTFKEINSSIKFEIIEDELIKGANCLVKVGDAVVEYNREELYNNIQKMLESSVF